ncbi:TerB family tellurite resistance protein [Polaribacter aestuariivivens]|uniref:TerB family tellurite resistance protein n=1 Tax=Polaribacter aestuariivivens TaxID=2304626 RepID=A0A5S3N5L1_9FLAO|nr:TerB family tellurite resistance protein [Polaribacter aestuariivivens]TMM30407.1 TerB family tellurite resistance protein [Polaribacter aestuariivivens]
MSFSNIYLTGKHKQEIGHFANIVKIAKVDGKITDDEKDLLIKVGKRLNITLDEFSIILNNPEKFPINPPVSYEERIERLYRLTKMILIDGEAHLKETKLFKKIAVGLHFSNERTEKVCAKAIELVLKKADLDEFTETIKKVDSN